MQSGDVAISLGTSDTIFVWLENFKEKEVQKANAAETTKPEGGNQQILGHIFRDCVQTIQTFLPGLTEKYFQLRL